MGSCTPGGGNQQLYKCRSAPTPSPSPSPSPTFLNDGNGYCNGNPNRQQLGVKDTVEECLAACEAGNYAMCFYKFSDPGQRPDIWKSCQGMKGTCTDLTERVQPDQWERYIVEGQQ